jgi:sortase A
VRRTIAGVGRALVTVGLLILLFVAYQLWGTGIFTARAQADLRDKFEQQQERWAAVTSTTTRPVDDSPVIPLPPNFDPAIDEGSPIGRITIPKIGVNQVVVEGTDREELKKGPGHYPSTPLPGQLGNAAIAGHRTTYGAPFFRLDELDTGDTIVVETIFGKYTYRVYQKLVVRPTDVSVADNTPDPQITLTTCNPRYSAAERLVVKGRLVRNRSSKPTAAKAFLPKPASNDDLEAGLQGDAASRSPAVGWGVVAAVIGLAWWWFFRRYRHPATWLAGVVPFLAVLFVFYVYLERMLPAGY